MERQKTYLEDINRDIYDFKDEDTNNYKTNTGLTPEIVKEISQKKNEPD